MGKNAVISSKLNLFKNRLQSHIPQIFLLFLIQWKIVFSFLFNTWLEIVSRRLEIPKMPQVCSVTRSLVYSERCTRYPSKLLLLFHSFTCAYFIVFRVEKVQLVVFQCSEIMTWKFYTGTIYATTTHKQLTPYLHHQEAENTRSQPEDWADCDSMENPVVPDQYLIGISYIGDDEEFVTPPEKFLLKKQTNKKL